MAAAAATKKKFDVVVMGATGYTGRLIAEYLAEHYAKGITWAIAGRSLASLDLLKDDLVGKFNCPRESVNIIVADSLDRPSLASMVASTRVILSAAGPFWKIGTPLVEECVAAGVHYCDITGESAWVKEIIAKFHTRAQETGAKIVPFCGIDSVPSDLGCYMMAQEMRRRHSCDSKTITMFVGPTTGGVSGGTCASVVNMVDRPLKEALNVLKMLGDPYALNPPGITGPPIGDTRGVWYNSDMKLLTAPWIMAGVDTRVVRRSNALLNNSYGERCAYHEVLGSKPTVKGLLKSLASAVLMPLFMILLLIPPTRALLKKLLPTPGTGPDLAHRRRGFFNFFFLAQGEAEGSPLVRGLVSAKRDLYTATAVIAVESAVCLAKDGNMLDKAGGVLTPAAAMKDTLLDRLNAAGISFTVQAGKSE